jgi:hypothetical protein
MSSTEAQEGMDMETDETEGGRGAAPEKTPCAKRKIDISKVLKGVPHNWRARYRRILEGERSPTTAIRVKCAECVGFEDVVSRVRECQTERCPLWAFRPFQQGT